MLRLVPPYPQAEFIFVIDQSGSMSGSQMEDAKSALQILIRSIPEGSKFNSMFFYTIFFIYLFIEKNKNNLF